MSLSKPTNHFAEDLTHFCANQCAEITAVRAGVEAANEQCIEYLKRMITSLLENQMNLSAALDETREACAKLNLQKLELEASNTQEMQMLQTELSLCRLREAETATAYEDLRSRVEAIDQIIEQIPCLDVIFNSNASFPTRFKTLECGDEGNAARTPHFTQAASTLRSASYDHDDGEADIDEENNEITPHHHHHRVPVSNWRCPKRNGSISPLSDSGCTSESHDEISLTSFSSSQSSPYPVVLHGQVKKLQNLHSNDGVRMHKSSQQIPLKHSATTYSAGCGDSTGGGSWKPGRISESIRASILRLADKSEWKMEALVSKQREARALLLLNETQAEVRKVKSRCCGLTRRQNEQELRMAEKVKEIDRLLNQERELRRDLRHWQQRVFRLETEVQEVLHNSQITELEMKSRLLEASMFATVQNPATFFNGDHLIQAKVPDDAAATTTLEATALASSSSSSSSFHSKEDAIRLRKISRSHSQRRPRFASVNGLTHLSPRSRLGIGRSSSSYQLNQSSRDGEEMCCQASGRILTTSIGSFSELELKSDL